MWRSEVARYPWPVEEALTIMHCESRGNPLARGDNGNSLGLMQLWRGWAPWYGVEAEALMDPATNIAVAYAVYEHRGHWGGAGGWSCADINGIR